MDKPKGHVVEGKERKAPKQWHEKFNKVLLSNGFLINDADKCLYCKSTSNSCAIICLYVDDDMLMGTNLEIVTETKAFLESIFDMKDMGIANVIHGIKITRDSDGIGLSQTNRGFPWCAQQLLSSMGKNCLLHNPSLHRKSESRGR
ncbi:unnamed protein product [Prunus armeniaca]